MKINHRTGSILGNGHRRKGINNQDSFCLGEVIDGKKFLFGAVFDGCTGKKKSRNETSAHLMAQFIQSEISHLIFAKTPLLEIPTLLYPRCVSYLGQILRISCCGPKEVMANFIEEYLLSTILGVVTDHEWLITFSAGDGMVINNDHVQIINQQNRPLYPGLHLLDREYLKNISLPNNFELQLFHVKELERLALSTDGLCPEWQRDHGIINNIWEHEKTAQAGLQWWLNRESNINRRFSDDCTIIALSMEKEVIDQ